MAIIIELRVSPASSRQEWCVDKNGKLKLFLKNSAVDGKANKELIKVVAQTLKIPQQDVEIVSGLISKSKRIKIHTSITLEQFLQACGIDRQMPLL